MPTLTHESNIFAGVEELESVVAPQNLVHGTIVDVCVLGVKLAIALRTISRRATHPSIEGWNVPGSPNCLKVVDAYRPNLRTDKERSKTLLLGATP